MKESNTNAKPLMLEMLGMHEFYTIAFMVCKEEVPLVLKKLNKISKDLPNILEQDERDMALTCEKARKIEVALK